MAIEMLNQDAIGNQCKELTALLTRHTDGKGDGVHKTDIDQLEFARESAVSATLPVLCQPILGIIIQGKKEALLGEETYRYDAAQYIVISVDLPLSGFVVEATPDKPYLGFKLNLDPRQLCDIIAHSSTTSTRKPARDSTSNSPLRAVASTSTTSC